MGGDLLLLLAAVVVAGAGGELFVRGAVGLAAWARVPAGLIGTTVAAFATSSPELSVGIQAAATGTPELALGDALGSNVMNVGLVLGITLLLAPLAAGRAEMRRDLGLAVVAPVVTLLAVLDGRLGRLEAVMLLGVFAGWLLAIGREALRARSASVEVLGGRRGGWRVPVSVVAGLALLIVAGRMIVVAAKGIGGELGLDPFVVGATLVALGTSTPELATALISRRRGHADVGVGTVIGSNVFNNLWIVGVVAMVEPIRATASEVLLAVVAGVTTLLLLIPRRDDVVPRWRGALLIGLTAAYVAGTVALGP
jgi:cation:H+ antiporter